MPDNDENKLDDLPTKSSEAAAQARQQAAVYESVFAPKILRLDNGTEIEVPPHPNLRMFDDEAQAELDELNFELESYDRHPDVKIPEQKVYDKNGNLTATFEATTQRGQLITPHRKTDENGNAKLLSPPYEIQVVKIAIGEDNYAKLRAGTVNGHRGRAADVWQLWNEQGASLADRQNADSKSDGGGVDLEAVPAPDSQ